MLYLPTPSQKDLDDYFNLFSSSVLEVLTKSKIRSDVKAEISRLFRQIITAIPSDLISYHDTIMEQLIPGFSQDEFDSYLRIQNTRKKTAAKEALINKYKVANKLSNVFDYNRFISSSKATSYKIASKLNRNTCTYCNRLYTITVIGIEPATGRINSDSRITRPQFDHWYAKSKYPILGLSYYNLIPSCSVCNSSIKGDITFSLTDHVHPYIKEKNQDFHFTYGFDNVGQIAVDIRSKGKIARTLKDLRIQEIYNAHSTLELSELYDLRHRYSENYLNALLFKTFDNLKISKIEAYRFVFGTEYEEADFHKRPFSKFKKDILSELGITL